MRIPVQTSGHRHRNDQNIILEDDVLALWRGEWIRTERRGSGGKAFLPWRR